MRIITFIARDVLPAVQILRDLMMEQVRRSAKLQDATMEIACFASQEILRSVSRVATKFVTKTTASTNVRMDGSLMAPVDAKRNLWFALRVRSPVTSIALEQSALLVMTRAAIALQLTVTIALLA